MPDRIKIAIVDDQPLFRAGIRSLLSEYPKFKIVSETDSGKAFIRTLKDNPPQVILLEITKELTHTYAYLKKKHPEMQALIPAFHNPGAISFSRIKRDIHALLSNNSGALVSAALIDLQRIISHFNELIIRPMILDFLSGKTVIPEIKEPILTRREEQVLDLMLKGYTRKEIAEILFMSLRTFDTHRDRIMAKLGIKRLADLFGPEALEEKSQEIKKGTRKHKEKKLFFCR